MSSYSQPMPNGDHAVKSYKQPSGVEFVRMENVTTDLSPDEDVNASEEEASKKRKMLIYNTSYDSLHEFSPAHIYYGAEYDLGSTHKGQVRNKTRTFSTVSELWTAHVTLMNKLTRFRYDLECCSCWTEARH